MDYSDLIYKKVKLDETAVECIRFKSKLTDFSIRQRNEKYVSALFHCSGTRLWHHLKHKLVQKTLMASKDGDMISVDHLVEMLLQEEVLIHGKNGVITEMDGSNKKGIDKAKYLIKKLQMGPGSNFIRHEVYVIDECHLLSCDSDIVDRMRKISEEENLDVDCDALYLIALNVEGSLRDAKTMLDQLSLLGKRITNDVVNELLMELLKLAMSSNTADTVKRARELMDLGIDPMVLMSQMAKLIMDIIAGTYEVVEARYGKLSIQLCNLRFSYLAPN
ncbi:AAA-type ATPase family protein [Artemisia annua]|uniref:AAA-type ATPase family protein n=1 Tax=Artemisia annua TaxID=35608 RepID=A0A2U1LVY1_ARTAN|nr:AAA-type ATPase family protein [Artemisia annua]